MTSKTQNKLCQWLSTVFVTFWVVFITFSNFWCKTWVSARQAAIWDAFQMMLHVELKKFRKILYMFLPITNTEKCLLQKLFSFVFQFFLVLMCRVKKSTVTSENTSKVGANYHLSHSTSIQWSMLRWSCMFLIIGGSVIVL